MPRLTHRFPAYRLHKASGQAIVTLEGGTRYLGVYDSPESRAEYRRLKAEWTAAKKAHDALIPPRPLSKDPSLNEIMLAYWKRCERHHRRNGVPTPELDNVRLALRHLKPYGLMRASEFGAKALITLRAGMIDSGLARRTINARVTKIKGMFAWAVREELIPPSALGVLAVKGLKKFEEGVRETAPVKPVAQDKVKATLPYLPAPVRTMVQLQALTGMRSSEVITMRGREIDREGSVWFYRPAEHKTARYGKVREIPLGPKAQAILKDWLKDDPDEFLFSPARAVADRNVKQRQKRKTPLWPSHTKSRAKAAPQRKPRPRYDKRSYYQAIDRACARAFLHPTLEKIKPKLLSDDQRAELKAWRESHRWHPHQLRHAAGTLIRRKYGVEVAQVFLGHSKMRSSEIYSEADTSKVAKVARQIG